jgi:hypothetical protein
MAHDGTGQWRRLWMTAALDDSGDGGQWRSGVVVAVAQWRRHGVTAAQDGAVARR